jgi:hypothetical protein
MEGVHQGMRFIFSFTIFFSFGIPFGTTYGEANEFLMDSSPIHQIEVKSYSLPES